jgi:ribonuclease P protein component
VGLPLIHRLKQRRDFQTVYQQGIRRYSRHLILRALLTPPGQGKSPSPTRIGIAISQKVSKKAVVRNRLKRKIRAAMREFLPSMADDWQIVIVVRPAAVECKYEHFLRELKQLLIKAEIIDGHKREHLL